MDPVGPFSHIKKCKSCDQSHVMHINLVDTFANHVVEVLTDYFLS